MSDFLRYRIPGKEIVSQTGHFRAVRTMKEVEGFFVSTFLKDQFYSFVPSEGGEAKCFFSEDMPVCIERDEYLQQASSFLESFASYKIKKAVLSRIKKVSFDENKIEQFFEKLCAAYPTAFVYLLSGEEVGTWMGASPEILLQTVANSGFTMSLAGTKPISSQQSWSEKERLEQAYVTGFIEEKLISSGVKKIEMNGPYDIEAGPVVHLRTDISFDIESVPLIDLAQKLHPSPAVSGLPQKSAVELINFREAHERQLYTGMIGVLSKKSSAIYVNLRCCQIQKGAAFLYLGGGYTIDSNPEAEWEETENKSKTLQDILSSL